MDFNHYFHNEELIYTAGSSLTLGQLYFSHSWYLKLSLKSPEIDIFLDNHSLCSYGIYSRHYILKIDRYKQIPIIDNTIVHETKKVMLV